MNLTRQQLYDRIRETSKEAFILEEMKRLGFWEKEAEKPSLSEELIKREVVLRQELAELSEKQRKYDSRETLLKEMRQARMKASKEKQDETRARNEEKRAQKALKWQQTKSEDIIYLGNDVSAGLSSREANIEKLTHFGLSNYDSLSDLATAMQSSIAQLRFLAFQRNVSKVCHYHQYYLPKKSGGKRLIAAPKTKLKQAQNWVKHEILDKIEVSSNVHGFLKGHSIVSNAMPHVQKEVVISLDIKDFFPSISYKRVKGLFQNLGYSEQLATLFALICTAHEVDKLNVDGQIYYAQKGERFVPQGSPASPVITNLIAYKMDKRLEGLAKKLGFTYTRYADDLTFSSDNQEDLQEKIGSLLYFIKKVVKSEGFEIHEGKTHVMRKGAQQKVTGIVVNDHVNINRDTLRKFRAFLHNVEKNGWENQTWASKKTIEETRNAAIGFASFVQMVNKEKGEKLMSQIKALPYTFSQSDAIQEHNISIEKTSSTDTKSEETKDWWDIF